MTGTGHRYRELVLSKSKLWSTLDNKTQCEEELKAALMRSNNHDLYIHAFCAAPDAPAHSQPRTDFNTFMHLLYPHAHRWATYSLSIIGPPLDTDDSCSFLDMENNWDEYPQEIAESVFAANAGVKLFLPRLRSVCVTGARTLTDAPFGAWTAPAIESLSFQNTSEIWLNYNALSSLEETSFTFGAHPRYGFDMQPFHGRLAYALMALPTLKILRLTFADCNVSEWEEDEMEDLPPSPVTLPHLKSLAITVVHGGNLNLNNAEDLADIAPLARFMRALDLPSLEQLEVNIAVSSASGPVWTRAILPADALARWPRLTSVCFREQALFRSNKDCGCGHCFASRARPIGNAGDTYVGAVGITRGACSSLLIVASRLAYAQHILAEVPCAPPVSCLVDLYDFTEASSSYIASSSTSPFYASAPPTLEASAQKPGEAVLSWDPPFNSRLRPFAHLRSLRVAYGEERCAEHCPASISYPAEWHAAAKLNYARCATNPRRDFVSGLAPTLLPPACGHGCGACAFRCAVVERTGAIVELVTKRCEIVKSHYS